MRPTRLVFSVQTFLVTRPYETELWQSIVGAVASYLHVEVQVGGSEWWGRRVPRVTGKESVGGVEEPG